jgi:hypothetical protein
VPQRKVLKMGIVSSTSLRTKTVPVNNEAMLAMVEAKLAQLERDYDDKK